MPYATSVMVTTDNGERALAPGEVAIRYSDKMQRWVAVSVEPRRARVLECSCAWSDGNAIDEAAVAFGVDAERVIVDLKYV